MPSSSAFFVTGTDTGVGKTFFTSLWIHELRQQGIDAVGYKPVACGDRDDARLLSEASGGLPLDVVNPLWLQTAAAPLVAASLQGVEVDVELLWQGFELLQREHEVVIVEGAGGWEVPLTNDCSIGDFARRLNGEVVMVVANRLGAINHSVLTTKAIRAQGLTMRGLVLNHLGDEWDSASISNKNIIPQMTQLTLLAELIRDQDWLDMTPGLMPNASQS